MDNFFESIAQSANFPRSKPIGNKTRPDFVPPPQNSTFIPNVNNVPIEEQQFFGDNQNINYSSSPSLHPNMMVKNTMSDEELITMSGFGNQDGVSSDLYRERFEDDIQDSFWLNGMENNEFKDIDLTPKPSKVFFNNSNDQEIIPPPLDDLGRIKGTFQVKGNEENKIEVNNNEFKSNNLIISENELDSLKRENLSLKNEVLRLKAELYELYKKNNNTSNVNYYKKSYNKVGDLFKRK